MNILRSIKYWIAHRTYDKYNIIKIRDLGPHYHEIDTRMLHGMFALLVDYLEVELANKERWCNDSKYRRWYHSIPFVGGLIYYHRNPKLGLKYIHWGSRLRSKNKDEDKLHADWRHHYKEVYALYKWWTNDRPARNKIDKIDALLDKIREEHGPSWESEPIVDEDGEVRFYKMKDRYPKKIQKRYMALLHKSWDQEREYCKEDESMLLRLVKIREGLWT